MATAESQELGRRSREIYEQRLKAILEPSQHGMFVAIEPDSGDYFLGKKIIDAMDACRQAHPDRLCYIMRVGHRAAVEFGIVPE